LEVSLFSKKYNNHLLGILGEEGIPLFLKGLNQIIGDRKVYYSATVRVLQFILAILHSKVKIQQCISLVAEISVSLFIWKGFKTTLQFSAMIRPTAKEIFLKNWHHFLPLPNIFIFTLDNLDVSKDPREFFDVLTEVIAVTVKQPLKESKKTTINRLGTALCVKLTSHLPLVGDGEP
jgi:hypothetical protein